MEDRNDIEPDRYQAALRHSKSYDAGNYDAAYVSEDLETAWRKREGQDLSRRGYVLGFWSSYEPHEVPERYREELEGILGQPFAWWLHMVGDEKRVTPGA